MLVHQRFRPLTPKYDLGKNAEILQRLNNCSSYATRQLSSRLADRVKLRRSQRDDLRIFWQKLRSGGGLAPAAEWTYYKTDLPGLIEKFPFGTASIGSLHASFPDVRLPPDGTTPSASKKMLLLRSLLMLAMNFSITPRERKVYML